MIKGDHAAHYFECAGSPSRSPACHALRGVDLDVRRRRGALRARPERRGQVDADQDPRRRVPARRRRDHLAGRAASTSRTPSPRSTSASPPCTRSSTSSTASPSPRTSSSATSSPPAACCTGARSERRPASCSTRLGHGDLSPHREVGTLSAAQQADREHGARAVARHEAHHHGRAERRARLRRGQEPVPRRRASSPPRASRSSTSRTASRRSARSATASPSSRTAAAWPAASRSPTPRPRSSSG